jgi:tetratricopeptide (TPR) repeat protein
LSLDSQLSALEAADLIRLARPQPELEYLFRHALVQDAVYASLLKNSRRELHLAVGALLEKLHAARIEEYAAVLAHHFQQAGDDRRALRYLTLAGDAAAGKYALAESALHYGHALNLARQAPGDPAQVCRLIVARGRVLEISGLHDEALAGYLELEALGERLSEPRFVLAALMPQAALRATPSPMYDPERGAKLIESALPLAHGLGDRAAEAKILWLRMVLIIYSGGDWAVAHAAGEQSLEITRHLLAALQTDADRRALREQVGFILHDLFFVYVYWGLVAQAEAVLQEAIEHFRELGNLPMLAEALVFMCNTRLMTGRYDEALAFSAESLRVGIASRHEYSQAYGRILAGRIYIDRGEFDYAIATIEEAIALGERSAHVGLQFFTRSDLAWAYGMLGAFDKGLALALLAQGSAEAFVLHFKVMAQAVQVRVYLLAGNAVSAAAVVSAMRTSYDDILSLKARLGAFLPAWAEVVLAEITYALATSDYIQALSVADEYLIEIRRGALHHFIPEALYLKACALMARGDLIDARAALDEARGEAEAIGARRHLWPILSAQAELADRQGNTAEAHTLRMQARVHVAYIADHSPDPALRRSFLALPAVAAVWTAA